MINSKTFWAQITDCYSSVKGSFTPEQFGVFLNMHSTETTENYLVSFHENYHYWQSIFTPYGHLKWGCYRTVSNEVIDLWLKATEETPSMRTIPVGRMLPCKSLKQVSCIAQIFVQDIARRITTLEERLSFDPIVQKVLPIRMDDICPTVCFLDMEYRMNGIDILESFAKFQEASLACLVEGKSFAEVIDICKLRPEYYSAMAYFIERVGSERILEFPILCELALSTDKLCQFDREGTWKNHHPAWRFVKMIDVISTYTHMEYLEALNIKERFTDYAERLLQRCSFTSLAHCWDSAIDYASQDNLNISKDMLRSITFKRQYPWALSFPFLDNDVFIQMKEFHPYYYIMTDLTSYTVSSESLGNEVLFENHYQALAHQICGNMSQRCLDRTKIQCGFSYYGLKGCQYQKNGSCDGHIDHNSKLPEVKIDADENIVDGCAFEIFLSLMGIKVQELNITDIATKIDAESLSENVKALKDIS